MKFTDLRPCDRCGGGLGITFFRVHAEHHVVDLNEARKRHAMDVMFPGAPGIAATFHGDGDDATKVAQGHEILLCSLCFCRGDSVPVAWEKLGKAADAKESPK